MFNTMKKLIEKKFYKTAEQAGTKIDVFFAVGRLDVGMENLHALYPDLLARGVPLEVHTFAGHPHGYAGWKIMDGVGFPNFDLWVTHADAFLRDVFKV